MLMEEIKRYQHYQCVRCVNKLTGEVSEHDALEAWCTVTFRDRPKLWSIRDCVEPDPKPACCVKKEGDCDNDSILYCGTYKQIYRIIFLENI